ncbi:proton-conducting transporter transmembrane domain-containing protein [Pengzhenrongella frigida]|uniref:Hydrogenase n=1 Tax=Pengzhenrongella frigida TaxID=1259133 RepID=A0A4Q5N2J9_9MICO|nr:proton-conducting transporter membrane subunit [Cellulomonas sp. HLT2-17]RYV50817.1 hydrogenase [Cellulomonas sp. HLT2-17]
MSYLLLVPILAPLVAAGLAALLGWRRLTAYVTLAAAFAVLLSGAILVHRVESGAVFAVGHLLRADSLTVTMLLVMGTVGTLATWASVGYIDAELRDGHTDRAGAHLYAVLLPLFLAAMALAVVANNIGVMWVAIEATTVATAFLVGHRRTRAAFEAAWKYVVICSVGIALALLGTVLLYFVSLHAGASSAHALDIDTLLNNAAQLDPDVTRLAAGLLLLGYGAKAGLVPFHTWLADAHSQAPAPVSALMSGVLLSVAFASLLRVKSVVDLTLGTGFLRAGLLVVGLLTVLIAASLLVVQTDFKRMLAYSSMENMGLVAIAAAAGTKLAIAALLLHVLAHGIGKSLVFLAAGQLQAAHDSTAISAVTGVLTRSRLVGVAFAVGLAVLIGLPPFAMFASELSIARALAGANLGWVLGATLLLLTIAFASLVRNGSRMLLGPPQPDAPTIALPGTVAAAMVTGIILSLALGLSAGPLTALFQSAATQLGASS